MDTELQAESGLHQPGTVVGDRYRITAILGQGGSGITYAAEDLQQNRPVALKALSLQRMQDWKQLQLFEREAQVLAKLDHPQIPRYLDHFHVDTDRDRSFYIVQALAPGQDLAQRVQNGWRTDEAGVRKIVRQVLGVLTYLHQLKPPVVHRDLKPQNLVMGDDGTVYLVDFGAVQETYYNTFMRGSTMVGTFGYMAPEQFRGQAVPQTDLYALGATVLFLLTHRSPAELPQERLRVGFRSHVQLSDAFADWLERCLEPDLDERMASAKDAAAALQGRFVLPNWRRVVPWKMLAGLGAASAVAWFGFDAVKYDLLRLSGLESVSESNVICRAVQAQDMGTVRSFLRFGDKRKKLTKLMACASYSEPVLRAILDSGVDVDTKIDVNVRADVNAKPAVGATLLHWVVGKNGGPKAVQLLLDKGADINAKTLNGDTPLIWALGNMSKNSIETVKLLLAKGADVNATAMYGVTVLHYAVSFASLEKVRLLLVSGANVNVKSQDGVTPLQAAVAINSVETVKLLLAAGANVNVKSQDGRTLLEMSTSGSNASEIETLLRSHGAK